MGGLESQFILGRKSFLSDSRPILSLSVVPCYSFPSFAFCFRSIFCSIVLYVFKKRAELEAFHFAPDLTV
jgi:hypothetical protein